MTEVFRVDAGMMCQRNELLSSLAQELKMLPLTMP